MHRPLTRYIAVFLLLYILIGSLYIFGLFNLHLFSKHTGPAAPDIQLRELTAESYPLDNDDNRMEDELMLEYELEGDTRPDLDGKLAVGASAKWKKTLLEYSRIKRDVRALKTQLALQHRETDRLKYLLELATSNPKCPSTIPSKQKTSERTPDFLTKEYIEMLSSSSIYCMGADRSSRTCRVKNLYYNIDEKQFFIIQGPGSEFVGMPNATQFEMEGKTLLDLTSLQNHGAFTWTPERVAEGFLDHPQSIYRVIDKTVMISRFVPGNTMHAIHDDILGYYYLLCRWTSPADGLPFDGHHHLMFLDDHGESPYSHLYKYFTFWPPRYKVNDLENLESGYSSLVLFNDVIIGNSKEVNWYQYGFSEPQGPIPDKLVSGHKVRNVASFLMMRMKIPLWNSTIIRDTISTLSIRTKLPEFHNVVNEHLKDFYDKTKPPPAEPSLTEMTIPQEHSEEPCIAIFSRRGDRLMLNERRLALALNTALKLPVYFVRNEDLSFKKQILILRRSVIAIGMHGSILIMGMFLPPGALLIELYPLYVPPENYTPYRTMANLPGMNLWYGAWSNKYPQLNVPHPEYPTAHGGLETFSEELRNKILSTKTVPKHLCCTDPFWLFRIYQDTYVHIPEILTELIAPGLVASNRRLREGLKNQVQDAPIPPAKININKVNYHWSLDPLVLHLQWEQPWNVPVVERYGVWVHQAYTEYDTNRPMLDISGLSCAKGEVHVWIRSYYTSLQSLDMHTDWSQKLVCQCPSK